MDTRNNIDLRRNNERLYLDIVKGVAVFLMLWGHCIQCCSNKEFDFYTNGLFKFIYSFHMPLFMLVSGYLFFYSCEKRTLSELLTRRTHSLLQPIIMCSILNYFLTIVLSQRTLSSIVDGPWINTLSILWFLWSTLSASIVVGISVKVTNKPALQILFIILGFAAVYFFPNCQLNLFMYPFFAAGYLFSKYHERIPKQVLLIKYISLPLFPVMLLFYQKKHYIYTTGIIPAGNLIEQIKIDGFRWAIGLVGSVFVLVVIEFILKHIIANKPMIAKPLSLLGAKSLQVYCLSVPILSFWLPKIYAKVCDWVGSNALVSNMYIYNFVFTPFLALFYSILLYFLVKLMDKLKISRVVFGR